MPGRSSAHSRCLRHNRWSDIGCKYLLTFHTEDRRKIFLSVGLAQVAASSFHHYDMRGACFSYAWVVMPDHVHWVLQLQAGTLSNLVKVYKTWVAKCVVDAGGPRRVWARGFHDSLLTTDSARRSAVSYVRSNPGMASLVDWPFVFPPLDD